MARTVAPGNAPEITTPQYKIEKPDFSQLDKLGTYLIKASDNNFKLYSDMLYKTESAKLFQQYSDKPMELSAALGKLPEMFKDLPEDLQEEMTRKIYIDSVGLVQKAQNNFLVAQDQQNKQNALGSAEMSKALMEQQYQNILQNHISPKEQKDEISNEIFGTQYNNLDAIADLQDHNGKYMFSDAQRKAFRNIDNLEYDGFRQFVDTMILNDNEDLQQTKDYYTKFVLAPDRFMKENYMNRETYDKSRTYIEKELKRAGAEIKEARFNQNMLEAMSLQLENTPGRIQALKDAGWDPKLLDSIEKTNAKFDAIDPSKVNSPIGMIVALETVNNWKRLPEVQTEEEKLLTLAEGTQALDEIADWCVNSGASQKHCDQVRKMVVAKEQDRMYSQMLEQFGEITHSFGTVIPDLNRKLDLIRTADTKESLGDKITHYTPGPISYVTEKIKHPEKVLSDDELERLGQLNEALAIAEETGRLALRAGDLDAYYKAQSDLSKKAAMIKYDKFITATQWADWEKNPEKPVKIGAKMVKIIGFTDDGEIIAEE